MLSKNRTQPVSILAAMAQHRVATAIFGMLALTAMAGNVAGCGGDDAGDLDTDTGAADTGSTDVEQDVANDAQTDVGPVGPCDPTPGMCDGFSEARPGRLSEHGAAFSEATLEMVVFGGTTAIPENCGFPTPDFVNETWLFDVRCDAWTRIGGSGPEARGRHMMTQSDDTIWMFGGRFRAGSSGSYTMFNDVWRFDPSLREWTEVEVNGASPSARVNGSIIWDSSRDLLWLFAGNDSASGATYTPLDDVWSFDPATGEWTEHTVSGGPERRLFHTGFYDATRDRFVVHGGGDETAFFDNAQYFDDIWALDLETLEWEELRAGPGAPAGRFWGRMVHDTEIDTYVLFGGHDDEQLGNRNDLWEYDPVDERWYDFTGGDTFNAPANGFCDFPADFVTVEAGTPERRNAHTLVWSETCGYALTFAGKTDCGAADDVWEIDYSVTRDSDLSPFTNRVTALSGELCARFRNNIDNCANMCF